MLTSVKRLIFLLTFLTFGSILGIFLYTNNRTFSNSEDLLGNTAGNIYNGGLFCEQEGQIFFRNDKDHGSLYGMNSDTSGVHKIHPDKVAYINADHNYLYYIRVNHTRENQPGSIFTFNNTGIYRINQNGSQLKLISNAPGGYLTLKGNHLYYQHYDVEAGLHLYQNKIDASRERKLLDDAVIPAAFIDDSLYYSGYSKDHNINALDLSSLQNYTMFDGNYAMPIFHQDYMYYLDLSDRYSIHRRSLDGSEQTLLVNQRCSTYNITNSGTYLYYQVDDLENSHIGRINLFTMEQERIMDGNFHQIHVTSQYVFFKDFDQTNTYVTPADGPIDLGIFDPTK